MILSRDDCGPTSGRSSSQQGRCLLLRSLRVHGTSLSARDRAAAGALGQTGPPQDSSPRGMHMRDGGDKTGRRRKAGRANPGLKPPRELETESARRRVQRDRTQRAMSTTKAIGRVRRAKGNPL